MPDYEFLKAKLNKIANKYPEVPTEKQYEQSASYFEDGEPKFPIRHGKNVPEVVTRKDIADAKRLMHHVSPENQEKVKAHIEKVEKELNKDDE
jgi:hypothetical protein